jgi:hypothetical protein
MSSQKKITRVNSNHQETPSQVENGWKPTPENKSKASQFRLFAAIAWAVAIGIEILFIYKIYFAKDWNFELDVKTIAAIVVMAILAVSGNLLWKKANRLDPASIKNSFKFFVQNQLGAIISTLAFLPLLVLLLTNKNIDGKTKGILGAIVGVALLIGVGTGIETAPPSVEQYAEETQLVEELNNGVNLVYWTKFGKNYHLNSSCSYINSNKTHEIFEGTVGDAKAEKGISKLCDLCERRARKNLTPADENEHHEHSHDEHEEVTESSN